ncbi:hypothetical protein [Frankia sp. KB5]|uniref:hypothetical protein n=1 Tax=Frankia sp. KB5 TaxID=683318 RepID=UPI000A11570B|nr:hypothetical protein [Frankia sp. KB5]ORT56510.1 hypothetical protein KBI5_00925 [Frankia sp. KB5]
MGTTDRYPLSFVIFAVFFAAACAAEGIVAVALGWSPDLVCEPVTVTILLILVALLAAERHGDTARADRATIGGVLALIGVVVAAALGLGIAILARDGGPWQGYLLIFAAIAAIVGFGGLGRRILARPSGDG